MDLFTDLVLVVVVSWARPLPGWCSSLVPLDGLAVESREGDDLCNKVHQVPKLY